MDRRGFLFLTTFSALGSRAPLRTLTDGQSDMYGLIGKLVATGGRRSELARILLEGSAAMPGCLSYVVAEDAEDEDALWVTEVWDSEASHAASLSLPSVQAAIQKGRPFIAGFGDRHVTTPLGGQGLPG
jgi:quinol monooxygenase YgiN